MAAWPDEPTRGRLAALERQLEPTKGLRFVGRPRWHVTLRFLGDVDELAANQLARALHECTAGQSGPVECQLGPATAWFTAVRVLQLPASGVEGLAATVRAATVPLVARPAAEPPFNGHLTLARSKGRRLSGAARERLEGVAFESTFAVHHIDLVSSAPSRDGHVYASVARVPLGPGRVGPG